MGKVKSTYWDTITADISELSDNEEREMQEALYYHSTVMNIIDIIERYGAITVIMDVLEQLKSKEIK